ncbi:MAG TPA: glycosyltransferase [Solirubrobacteraceae bacterium]|nr:glycosyltransferase [Solirubrobacteraceae bacterium]
MGAETASDDELNLSPLGDGLELGLDLEILLARNDSQGVPEALAPKILLDRWHDGVEPILHLPPTVWVCGRLTPIFETVVRHGVVLFPRAIDDPPADGLEPSAEQLNTAGRVAAGMLAVDGSRTAGQFLEWCSRRLQKSGADHEGSSLGPKHRYWERRLLELAPARFGARLMADPGFNLSAWNLHEHQLVPTADGPVLDRGWPLRFMDLAGYDPSRPHQLSVSSSRVRLSRDPALKHLSQLYGQELRLAGWRDTSGRAAVGLPLGGGVVFDDSMAALVSEAQLGGRRFGDIFSAEGAAAFLGWLREPAWPGAPGSVGRYVFRRVLRDRPDVFEAYPDPYGDDSEEFELWCRTFGVRELDIPAALVPGAEPGEAGLPAAPEPHKRRFFKPRNRPPMELQNGGRQAGDSPPSIRVTGYLSHVLGLGAAARGYADALEAAGVAVTTASVPLPHQQAPVGLATGYGRQSFDEVTSSNDHGFELICVNPDELPAFMEQMGESYFRGPRIGVWGWETDRIPPRWGPAFELLDEIWVYSSFMADNIGAVSPVPVVALPPAVRPPAEGGEPLRLGVPEGFLFLFAFDYLSTIQRKNPIGLINAFKLAFKPGEGPQLLIKTFNAPLRPLVEEELLWAADGRPDIHVVDRSLTNEQRDALMATCDCYVSLHRSEGFGLTPCEAMALGKPVIATAYSGNLDFMNEENSLLVSYEITRVGADCEIYPPDGRWADPDLEQAAELMRQVYENPAASARMGERARADVRRMLSPEATGGAMRRRLEELGRGVSPPPNRQARPSRNGGEAPASRSMELRPAPPVSPSDPRRKVLISAGTGELARCLDISLPTFEEFADRHGYDILVGDEAAAEGRPASWASVRLLQRALSDYEAALWVDADALIVDTRSDVDAELPPDSFQGLVRHHTAEGEVPNAGVWFLRAGPDAQHLLEAMWERTEFIEHPWWENAALMSLLGYDLGVVRDDGYARGPSRLVRESAFLAGTTWLDTAWNSISQDSSPEPRIRHWPGIPVQQRLAEMSEIAAALQVDRFELAGSRSDG